MSGISEKKRLEKLAAWEVRKAERRAMFAARNQEIVRLCDGRTQISVAISLGLSRSRVGQVVARARRMVAGSGGE